MLQSKKRLRDRKRELDRVKAEREAQEESKKAEAQMAFNTGTIVDDGKVSETPLTTD